MSLQHIFAQPDLIEGTDKNNPIVIHPIQLKDYDKFQECSKLLYLSKKHFEENSYPLLALVFMSHQQFEMAQEELIENLCLLFSLVTQKEVNFISGENVEGFLIDNINLISVDNYDDVRALIMRQNLMFDQKIFKDPLVQEWANKVIMSRQKNSANITMEDMITTVKNDDGLTYEQVKNQTVYQLYADFYRIGKFMQFQQSSLFATVSTEKI